MAFKKSSDCIGYPEIISWIIYLAVGIGLLVLSAQTFDKGQQVTPSRLLEQWESASAIFQRDVASLIRNNWSANVSSSVNSTLGASFSVVNAQVQAAPKRPAQTSTFLKASIFNVSSLFDNNSSSTSTPGFDAFNFVIKTEINVINISAKSLNFTRVNFSSPTVPATNSSCAAKYGSLSVAKANMFCKTPTTNEANCIVLQKRRNASGTWIWWPSFDVKGCSFPFNSETSRSVPLRSDRLDLFIREVNDPEILLLQLADGATKNDTSGTSSSRFATLFSVKQKDYVPDAVGILLCGLLLVVGSLIMGKKIILFMYIRYARGENLIGEEFKKKWKKNQKNENGETRNENAVNESEEDEELKKKE